MASETLAPATALGSALRTKAVAELDRAILHLGWRGSRVHEGVHQARKSMRRVRAAIKLGGPVLGADAEAIDRKLKKLLRSLSAVRDAQALVETLEQLVKQTRSKPAITLLRRTRRVAASARSDKARAAWAEDSGFDERRVRLASLGTRLAELPWEQVITAQISAAVAQSSEAARQAAVCALSSEKDDDWHRWRRRARRLSQQQRLLVNLGWLAGFKRSERTLAGHLGEAQNYSLLIMHCGKGSIFQHDDRLALCKLAESASTELRGKIASNYLVASLDPGAPSGTA